MMTTKNPFDLGEWIALRPEGVVTYALASLPSGTTDLVRRSAIKGLRKSVHHEGNRDYYLVRVAFGSGASGVMFEASPEGGRLVDLLIEACLGPPRQRMVELWGPYMREGKTYVAVDAIKTIVRCADDLPVIRFLFWVEGAAGFGTNGTRDQYHRDFETEHEADEFLRVCGAKVDGAK